MSDNEVLNSKTLVDLALLGFASDQVQTASVLIARIKRAGGDQFTPTADFIRERLASLVGMGHVEVTGDGDELVATPNGRNQILRLLRLELDPTASALRTVCTTLKLCLLDLVDEETRVEIVSTLCCSRDCCPNQSPDMALPNCPLMTRYLTIEKKRQLQENRFWQDTLLEEGLLDPAH
ncbi:MAG: hypothetical protein AAGC99_12420 [Pseudomonadota bacterium]